MHRQDLKKILFFSTKQLILRVGRQNKKIFRSQILFFSYFPENYSRRVCKSTNKKILA